jgi:hypothetical protein
VGTGAGGRAGRRAGSQSRALSDESAACTLTRHPLSSWRAPPQATLSDESGAGSAAQERGGSHVALDTPPPASPDAAATRPARGATALSAVLFEGTQEPWGSPQPHIGVGEEGGDGGAVEGTGNVRAQDPTAAQDRALMRAASEEGFVVHDMGRVKAGHAGFVWCVFEPWRLVFDFAGQEVLRREREQTGSAERVSLREIATASFAADGMACEVHARPPDPPFPAVSDRHH